MCCCEVSSAEERAKRRAAKEERRRLRELNGGGGCCGSKRRAAAIQPALNPNPSQSTLVPQPSIHQIDLERQATTASGKTTKRKFWLASLFSPGSVADGSQEELRGEGSVAGTAPPSYETVVGQGGGQAGAGTKSVGGSGKLGL